MSIERGPAVGNPNPTEQTPLHQSIESVHQNGDMFDRIKQLRAFSHAGAIALTGASIAGFEYGVAIDDMSALAAAPIALLATPAASLASRPYKRRRAARAAAPLSELYEATSDQFEGDSIEIYRRRESRKKYSFHVMWEPAEGKTATIDTLKTMSLQLADQPVDTITMPLGFLRDTGDKFLQYIPVTETNPWGSSCIVDRKTWLKHTKTRPFIDQSIDKDSLISLSRLDFHALVKEIIADAPPPEVENVPVQDPIDIYMGIIKEAYPKHPCLKYFNDETSQSPKGRQILAKSLRRRLESKLSDTDTQTIADEHGSYAGKQTVHTSGTIYIDGHKIPRITWSTDGKSVGASATLLGHFGIQEKALADLPDNVRSMHVSKLLTMSEVGAYLALKDILREKPKPREVIVQETKPQRILENNPVTRGVQSRIADRYTKKRRNIPESERARIRPRTSSQRIHASTALIGLALSVGAAANVTMDKHADNDWAARVSPLYDKLKDLNPDTPAYNETQKRIKYAERNQSLDVTAARKLTDIARDYQTEFFEKMDTLGNFQEMAPDEVKKIAQDIYKERDLNLVGNVENQSNKPAWFIESYGNMDSTGYWNQNSSNYFGNNSINYTWTNYTETIRQAGGINVRSYDKMLDQLGVMQPKPLPLPNSIDKNKPHLRIEKNITTNFMTHAADDDSFARTLAGEGPSDYQNIKQDYTTLDVPVMQNTEIVAAKFGDNTPLQVMRLGNNQQVIQIPEALHSGKIEYWLAPHTDDTLKAVGSIRQAQSKSIGSKTLTPPNSVWQKYASSTLQVPGIERVDAQASYISDTFSYKLAPLKDDPPHGLTEYAQMMMDLRVANCNTAGTLLAISNPTTLNVATGFNNTNTPEQRSANKMHLSTAESHLWTIDKQGGVHDPTPPMDPNSKEADYFKENYSETFTDPVKKRKQQLAIVGSIGALIAGMALTRRTRRRRLETRPVRSRKQLAKVDDVKLRIAHEIVEHAQYSALPFTTRRIQAAQERATRPGAFAPSHTPPIQSLNSSNKSYTPKEFRKHLRTTPLRTRVAHYRTIRTAQHLQKLSYFSQQTSTQPQ